MTGGVKGEIRLALPLPLCHRGIYVIIDPTVFANGLCICMQYEENGGLKRSAADKLDDRIGMERFARRACMRDEGLGNGW